MLEIKLHSREIKTFNVYIFYFIDDDFFFFFF